MALHCAPYTTRSTSPERIVGSYRVPAIEYAARYFYIMSEPSYISIKEMIEYMNSGKPFSLAWVTWDHAKGAGGSVKEVQLAFKHYQANSTEKETEEQQPRNPKNPNHFKNSTLNIKIPGQGRTDIRKVHVQLIRRFNGAIVK